MPRRSVAAALLVLAALGCAAGWLALQPAYSFVWRALRDADEDLDWGQAPPWPLFNLVNYLATWLPRLQARLLPPHLHVGQLGVADSLAGGHLPLAELARRSGVKSEELGRLLRAASSHGVFKEVGPGVWGNNRGSSVLRRSHPSSCNLMVQVWGDESYSAYEKLADSLQPGSPPAFELRHGAPFFYWLSQAGNEQRLAIFHGALQDAAKTMNAATLQDYPWQRHANQTVSDVGGGHGGFLAALLAAHPGIRGMLVDLPEVVAGAEGHWRRRYPELLGRVQMVQGDFFRTVPPADVFFLRYIIHDWSDAQAARILRTLRAAISAGREQHATLLIQDAVLPSSGPPSPLYAALDLQMLAISGGKERSQREWEQLLAAAGFRLRRVHRLRTLTAVLEAQAA
ncbi:hypothetical protein ABPG75_009952 [Micractinium tetrahymenae]